MPTIDELNENIDALMAQGVGHVNIVGGQAVPVDDPTATDEDVEEGITSIQTRGCLECENSPVPMACAVPTVFVDETE